jgi:hypothetical protein
MLVLALAGLWALAFGKITVTGRLSLEGRRARYYGLTLLVAAVVYGVVGGLVSTLIASTAPALAANDVLGVLVRFGIVAAIIIGLVPAFRKKPAGTIVAVYES